MASLTDTLIGGQLHYWTTLLVYTFTDPFTPDAFIGGQLHYEDARWSGLITIEVPRPIPSSQIPLVPPRPSEESSSPPSNHAPPSPDSHVDA